MGGRDSAQMCRAGAPGAEPESDPSPPPKSEITLRFGDPYFGGLPAFVTITNNEGKPPVDCVYRDGVNAIPFTVSGSAESRVDIPGFPTGTKYTVTVTCDNKRQTDAHRDEDILISAHLGNSPTHPSTRYR